MKSSCTEVRRNQTLFSTTYSYHNILGRIGLLELQPILNVSAEQIELKAQEMVNKYRTMHLVQGELISSTYIDRIAEEINESLREYGHVTIVEMSKRFGLSHDFISNVSPSLLAH